MCSYVQEQEDGVGGCGQFPYLLALHALCAADASLATPKADPQRFVRCLAPYISAAVVQQGILARSNSGEEGWQQQAQYTELQVTPFVIARCDLICMHIARRGPRHHGCSRYSTDRNRK